MNEYCVPVQYRSCCVPGCENRWTALNGVTLFRYPTDIEKRKLWMKLCCIDENTGSDILSRLFVCYRHFNLSYRGQRKLTEHMLPCYYLPDPEKTVLYKYVHQTDPILYQNRHKLKRIDIINIPSSNVNSDEKIAIVEKHTIKKNSNGEIVEIGKITEEINLNVPKFVKTYSKKNNYKRSITQIEEIVVEVKNNSTKGQEIEENIVNVEKEHEKIKKISVEDELNNIEIANECVEIEHNCLDVGKNSLEDKKSNLEDENSIWEEEESSSEDENSIWDFWEEEESSSEDEKSNWEEEESSSEDEKSSSEDEKYSSEEEKHSSEDEKSILKDEKSSSLKDEKQSLEKEKNNLEKEKHSLEIKNNTTENEISKNIPSTSTQSLKTFTESEAFVFKKIFLCSQCKDMSEKTSVNEKRNLELEEDLNQAKNEINNLKNKLEKANKRIKLLENFIGEEV